MLRRTKTIVFDDDTDVSAHSEADPSASRTARRGLSGLRRPHGVAQREPDYLPQRESIPDEAPNPVHERQDFLRAEFDSAPISNGSPDSLAALRAEFRRKHVENGEDKSSGVALPRSGALRPSRIILLAVALVAGGLAAYLAFARPPEATPPPAPAIVEIAAPAPVAPTADILVARAAIAVGTRLTPDLLEWQKWPEATIRPEYISSANTPEAMTDLGGAVARTELVAGEPIRREKLGEAGAGYLSAIIESGKRAVSLAIDARTASGGFIMPNDRVDIVLTRTSAGEAGSQTILTDVRVLAINARVGAPTAESATASPEEGMFAEGALATLELDPAQAELIINASTGGALSLVLRPLADASAAIDATRQAINQSIRMTSPFWLSTTQPGSGGTPASY